MTHSALCHFSKVSVSGNDIISLVPFNISAVVLDFMLGKEPKYKLLIRNRCRLFNYYFNYSLTETHSAALMQNYWVSQLLGSYFLLKENKKEIGRIAGKKAIKLHLGLNR